EVHAAIVTCGRLCPGLNTAIREIVCALYHMYGVTEVLGIDVVELHEMSSENLSTKYCFGPSPGSSEAVMNEEKVMDPPRPKVVDNALELLVHIKALERTSPRGRYEPAFLCPLMLQCLFRSLEKLECYAKASSLFSKFTDDYYNQEGKINGLMGRKEVTYIAILYAFQFWQRTFKVEAPFEKTDTQTLSLKIEVVESLARENFFFLRESFAFDEYSFGKLSDDFSTKKAMLVSKAIMDAFELHPPTDIQFVECASNLSPLFNKDCISRTCSRSKLIEYAEEVSPL
nr:DExH-box ATP-dependent RNA helicase DExH8 [Tanacetum cinerariifolium]GEX55902.1 DExH-box ATP-dependent RNA helicase DExH8 [Tanacetum cinerariifolium]